MSHLLFPARGLGRPGLRQVLSDPSLRSEFLRHDEVKAPGSAPGGPAPSATPIIRSQSLPAPKTAPAEATSGLDDLFMALNRAAAVKRRNHALVRDHERLVEQKRHQRLDMKSKSRGTGLGEDRPGFCSYTDPPGPFAETMYEKGASLTCTKDPNLQGMYETVGWKPPHWEKDVHGGWNPATRSERSDGFFGTKAPHRMAPKELMYANRLEKAAQMQHAQMAQDQLAQTTGSLRKQALAATAPAFSAHNRSQAMWVEPRRATTDCFSTPAPYKPGEQHFDEHLTTAITQPSRSSNSKRNFYTSRDHQTSHWRAPKAGHRHGTCRALQTSDELLLPPGVRRQREEDRRRRRAEMARSQSTAA